MSHTTFLTLLPFGGAASHPFPFSKAFPTCLPRCESLNQTVPIPVAWTAPRVQKTNHTPGPMMRWGITPFSTRGSGVCGWAWGLSLLHPRCCHLSCPSLGNWPWLVSRDGAEGGRQTDSSSTKGRHGCRAGTSLPGTQCHFGSRRYSNPL